MTSPPRANAGSFTGNVLGMLATQGLTFPLQIATGIMTARFLGPHDRGLYSLLLMIPQTLEVLLKLGVAPANIYMICREKVKSRHIVSNSVLLAFGLGAMAFLVLPFRDILDETILANVDGWYLTLAVSIVPLYILSAYLTSILQALNQFATANRQTIIVAGYRVVATFVVLVVLQKGLFEAFLVNVGGSALGAGCLLASVLAVTSASFRPNVAVAATTVRFGLKSHAQALLTAFHLRLDHFLIAFFLGPSEVAFYAIATHIAEMVADIHRPISVVLYPHLASTSEIHIHHTTVTVCRHVLFLELIAGVGVVLASNLVIVVLYGRAYLPALPPLFILMPGVLTLSLFNLLAKSFASRNKQQTTIVAGLAGLVVNTLLNILMIPPLGIRGAALASTVSYSLAAAILLVAFRRDSGISALELIRIRKTDVEFYQKLVVGLIARPRTARFVPGATSQS